MPLDGTTAMLDALTLLATGTVGPRPPTYDDIERAPIWLTAGADKAPRHAHRKAAGDSTDPATWGTRAQAEATAQAHGLPGVGVVPGDIGSFRLCCVDLDQCYDDEGYLADWAQAPLDWLKRQHCRNEISRSGHGLHGFFLVRIDTLPDDALLWKTGYKRAKVKKAPGGELYVRGRGRFIIVTDNLIDCPDIFLPVIAPPDLVDLHGLMQAIVPPRPKPAAKPTTARQRNGAGKMSDHERALYCIDLLPNDLHFADRNDWRDIIFALHSATDGSSEGLSAAIRWTESGNYEDAAEATTKVWHSAKASGGRGLGTLAHEVREAGFDSHPDLTKREDPPEPDEEPDDDPVEQAAAAKKRKTEPQEPLPLGVAYEDFYGYGPGGNFIYTPTGELWPIGTVNSRLPWIDRPGMEPLKPSTWLMRNAPVEQMTWAPGEPQIIRDRLAVEAGWIEKSGVAVFNRYRPPTIALGDPAKAEPWITLGHKLWPGVQHVIQCFALKRQKPHVKINHALLLGGLPGIGKDTWLQAVLMALGPWNVQDIPATAFLKSFNPFARALMLRINEARSGEKFDRFSFYENMKAYAAAPPDMLYVDEKFIRPYYAANVVLPVITFNKKAAFYLPSDDRRHYALWSELAENDMKPEEAGAFWKWYEAGGYSHVAAYLDALDLASFNPKAPPPKTPAFWEIVDISRAPEDAALADVLDLMGNPVVTTLDEVHQRAQDQDFRDWLADKANRRVIGHRFEECGYSRVRNDVAKDGLFKLNGKRQAIYGRSDLDHRTRLEHARALAKNAARSV